MDELVLFAKYWQPGRVKTRLAEAVGAPSAARLYRAFVQALLERLKDVAAQSSVAYWPPERHAEFESLTTGTSWQLRPQTDGDLGRRLAHEFHTRLASGIKRLVVVGSDSPTLPLKQVHRAFHLLNSHPVVLGPSYDGGYYLIGATGFFAALFDEISWSTDQVLNQTIRRLDQARIPFAMLAPWYDIDEPADLERLRTELAAARRDPVLAALREQLDSLSHSPGMR